MARLCVDSDDFQISPTGELQLKPGALGVQQMIVYTANDTFDKADYPDLARVWVRVVGGGGGSGASPAAASFFTAQSGGGGGGYAESIIEASALPASVAVTVGAGGAAGDVLGIPDGDNGGTSSFGAFVVASGGQGSAMQMTDVGPAQLITTATGGGVGTAGQILAGGGAGSQAIRLSASVAAAGNGGDSVLGGGRRAVGGSAAGFNGFAYGGGASGSSNLTGAAQLGGQGGPGVVIVVLIF